MSIASSLLDSREREREREPDVRIWNALQLVCEIPLNANREANEIYSHHSHSWVHHSHNQLMGSWWSDYWARHLAYFSNNWCIWWLPYRRWERENERERKIERALSRKCSHFLDGAVAFDRTRRAKENWRGVCLHCVAISNYGRRKFPYISNGERTRGLKID